MERKHQHSFDMPQPSYTKSRARAARCPDDLHMQKQRQPDQLQGRAVNRWGPRRSTPPSTSAALTCP